MSDLWGFKNVNELEKNTKDMPDAILKEQISATLETSETKDYTNQLFLPPELIFLAHYQTISMERGQEQVSPPQSLQA